MDTSNSLPTKEEDVLLRVETMFKTMFGRIYDDLDTRLTQMEIKVREQTTLIQNKYGIDQSGNHGSGASKENEQNGESDVHTAPCPTMPCPASIAADLIQMIGRAHKRISPFLPITPVLTSELADKLTGRHLFFKADNLQKTGSFKVRGALHAILRLKEKKISVNGVVTHSSGNHALALAWASRMAGIPCYTVIPEIAPLSKKHAIQQFGAMLVECGPNAQDRVDTCLRLQKELGLEFIPSSNDYEVMAGQGTLGLEFMDQVHDLDAILVTVGGGGMAAGTALIAKAMNPDIKIYLVTPQGKGLQEFLRTGKRVWNETPGYVRTIADGIRLKVTSPLCTPFLVDLAEKEVFEVDDDDVIKGMKFAFDKMKLVVEPAAGAAVGAVFTDKFSALDPHLRNIGIVICGGNVDICKLPWLSSESTTSSDEEEDHIVARERGLVLQK